MSNERKPFVSNVHTLHEGDIPFHRGVTYSVYSSNHEVKLNPRLIGNLCMLASRRDILLLTDNNYFPDPIQLPESEIESVMRNFNKKLNPVTGFELGTYLFDQGVEEELIDPMLTTMPPGLTFSVQTLLRENTNVTGIVRRFPYSTHLPYFAAIAVSPAEY